MNDVTLKGPKDRDTPANVTVGSIQADVTLSSVWSGLRGSPNSWSTDRC